jgi:hypothetical protein
MWQIKFYYLWLTDFFSCLWIYKLLGIVINFFNKKKSI